MSKDVVNILQHYRHDLMNRLQIVQGYASMGKTEKAEMKLDEMIAHYHEERKLMALKMPHFLLWAIQFDHTYSNFRINYEVTGDNRDLSLLDEKLLEKCNLLIERCIQMLDEDELFEVLLELHVKDDRLTVKISFCGNADFTALDMERLRTEISDMVMEKEENGISFGFSFAC